MSDEFEPQHAFERYLFSLLRDLYPVDEAALNAKYRGVDLYGRYWLWFHGARIASCLSTWPIAGLAAFWILSALSTELPQGTAQTLVLRHFSWWYCVPILGAAIIFGGFPVAFLFRILLGTRYREFVDYCEWKCGFDGNKAWKLVSIVTGIPSLLVLFFLHGNFVAFTADHIRIQSVGRFARRYSYADISAIAVDDKLRNPLSGEIRVKEPRAVVVVFRDGQDLQLPDNRRHGLKPSSADLAEWLSDRASTPVLHLTAFELSQLNARGEFSTPLARSGR